MNLFLIKTQQKGREITLFVQKESFSGKISEAGNDLLPPN